jgi:hypothetical protein
MLRSPITNEHWDAEAMLARAEAGAYPSAKHYSATRDAEIAYWRERAGMPAAPLDEAPADDEATTPDPTSDATFLARDTTEQRELLFCYLTSNIESDRARGAYLCGLLGYDLAYAAATAQAELAARLERSMRRLRLQTVGGRRSSRIATVQGPRLNLGEEEAA